PILPVEQPQRWGGLIDLDAETEAEAQVPLVAQVLMAGIEEDQLALREGAVKTARLVERGTVRPDAWRGFEVREDGAYLVTGGLGGVGWEVARWLVGKGAKHVHL